MPRRASLSSAGVAPWPHLHPAAVRLLAGDMFPGWWLLLAPVLEALLWPLVTLLLLAPQRRAPDPDQNRPL